MALVAESDRGAQWVRQKKRGLGASSKVMGRNPEKKRVQKEGGGVELDRAKRERPREVYSVRKWRAGADGWLPVPSIWAPKGRLKELKGGTSSRYR